MDYPRCKTCTHYKPCAGDSTKGARWADHSWDDGEPKPLYPGWCMKLEGPADEHDASTLPESGRMAITVDGSTYRADLLVTPDFGCILHSEIANG